MKEQLEQVKILMSPHPLTNFEIQNYYKKELKFNYVYSRNNLSKIKDGTYPVNLVGHESIGTHWIALYVNDNNVSYRYGVIFLIVLNQKKSKKS